MVTYIIVGATILGDIVTGFLNALKQGEVDSSKIRDGLFHKLAEVLAVVFAYGVDFALNYYNIGIDVAISPVVCVYILIMEVISIIENICAMNPSLSKLFSPYLNKLKEKQGSDKEE